MAKLDPNQAPGLGAGAKSGPQPIGPDVGRYLGAAPWDVPEGPAAGSVPPGATTDSGPGFLVPARYHQGDEWAQLPPSGPELGALQDKLVLVGLLDPTHMVRGQPDSYTAQAMAEILAVATSQGTDWQGALSDRLLANADDPTAVRGARSRQVPPLVTRVTNPADIAAVVKNTAKTLTGGVWNDADVANVVAAYQQQERVAQQAEYQAKYGQFIATGKLGPDAGGEFVAQPGAAGLADQTDKALIAAHPADAAVSTFSNNLGSIVSAMGWGGKGG